MDGELDRNTFNDSLVDIEGLKAYDVQMKIRGKGFKDIVGFEYARTDKMNCQFNAGTKGFSGVTLKAFRIKKAAFDQGLPDGLVDRGLKHGQILGALPII
jgi:hypothetical protein